MRPLFLILAAVVLGLVSSAGCASKRASVPNTLNGPTRLLPVIR